MSTSTNKRIAIDGLQAESLLFPVVILLRLSGLSKEAIESGLSLAYKRAVKNTGGRKITRIGTSIRYSDVISRWTHDKHFLDPHGNPRPLKLHGKFGLASLVRCTLPNAELSEVLDVLTRFRTLRLNKDGRYELIKPFFVSATPESLALEPTVHFLADATETLSKILTRNKRSRGPDVFWRNVDSTQLSMAAAKKFLAFTRQRTLTFLEELNEWLEANSAAGGAKTTTRNHRVGLGIFSIHSPA